MSAQSWYPGTLGTHYAGAPLAVLSDRRDALTIADSAGRALGEAAYERGERLSPDERFALLHDSRWGSDGYPVGRVGRKWALSHLLARGFPLFSTRRDAVAAWQTLLAKWRRMSGLEAQERASAQELNA